MKDCSQGTQWILVPLVKIEIRQRLYPPSPKPSKVVDDHLITQQLNLPFSPLSLRRKGPTINSLIILTLAGSRLRSRTLLGQKNRVNIRQHTSRRNSNIAQKFVQLLVVLNSQGQVTGHDTTLLVVAGGVTCQLENFGREVFEDGGEVDGCAGSHSGGVFALSQVSTDTTDGELKSCVDVVGAMVLAWGERCDTLSDTECKIKRTSLG